MPRPHALLLAAACLAAACHHPSVGTTCKVDADCGSGLECEIENNKGTCQEHHDDTEDHANDDDAGDGVDDATAHESTAHGGGTAEDTEHSDDTAEDSEHGGGSNSNSG